MSENNTYKPLILERLAELSDKSNNLLLNSYYINEAIKSISLITEEKFTGKVDYDKNEVIWDDFDKNIEKSTININTLDKAKEYFKLLYNKVKDLPIQTKKRAIDVATMALGGLMLANIANTNDNVIEKLPNAVKTEILTANNPVSNELKSVSVEKTIEKPEKTAEKSEKKGGKVFNVPNHSKMSSNLRRFIVTHEGFRSKAYDLHDGAYTIGYGHAIFADPNRGDVGGNYPFLPKYSNIKVNKTQITKKQALKLLEDDYKIAKDGLDRVFKAWKEKGIEYNITQNMYDAMVSMIFNSGVSNFRQDEVIQLVKKGPKYYKKAGEAIKNVSSDLFNKFPGLKTRREGESELFLKGIEEVVK
jgi:GH24 family phage-related lysozyme (muramidase)